MSQQPFTALPLPPRARYGVSLIDVAKEICCALCHDNYNRERCYVCGNLTCLGCLGFEVAGLTKSIPSHEYVCEQCAALPAELRDAVRTFRRAMEDAHALHETD